MPSSGSFSCTPSRFEPADQHLKLPGHMCQVLRRSGHLPSMVASCSSVAAETC